MQHPLYIVIFIVLLAVAITVLLIAQYKKNSHTELYKEGVHNENEGNYKLALQNFEDALAEIRKLKVDNKFGDKIEERIKILHTIIDYEKSFQNSRTI
jgi:hypothetical protein